MIPDAAFYFMSMVASTKRAMSRTRQRLQLPDAEGNGPGALPKTGPGPSVADDAALVERGGCAKKEGCRIPAGPMRGILSGFPSAISRRSTASARPP